MKVVICVCTYKRPEGLASLLHSLTQLTTVLDIPPEHEPLVLDIDVVVVDNDAAGEGATVCQQLSEDYPFTVHASVEPQAGISPARNAAVNKALSLKPTLLAFLDDDEQPEKQWLSELVRVQTAFNADVVGGPTLPVFPDDVTEETKNNDYFGADLKLDDGQQCTLQAAGNFLIKAHVISTMAPMFFHPDFAQSGGEDLAFFKQLELNGATMHWAANAIVSEPVPANRLTENWMKSRIITIHNSRVRVMRMLEPGAIPAMIRGLKTVALGIVAGLSTLLALILPAKRQQARMLRLKFWGKLSAHLRIKSVRAEEH